MRGALLELVTWLSLLSVACGALEEPRDELVVERFSELLIVDAELLDPSAAGEQIDFSMLMRALFGERAQGVNGAWFEEWRAASDRPDAFAEHVLCPWLRSSVENACDGRCHQCEERALALDQAPFGLSAIAYRPDLALLPDAQYPQGQLRFVFALRSREALGLQDELPITLIFEYALGARFSAGQWAARFHALAQQRDDPTAYRSSLRALVALALATEPAAPVTIRVRDDLTSDGRMLAWAPDATRGLGRIPLEDTVDPGHGSIASLRAALPEREVASQDLHVPPSFWADSVTRTTPSPTLPDPKLSATLRLISCQGCHADERSQAGFHIAPQARGRARVSRFLHDPERPKDDELARRADALRTLLSVHPE